MLDDVFDLRCAGEPGVFPIRDHFIEQMRIFFLLRRGVDQTRIGRGVLRLEFLDRLEIARVGDDFGKFLQLIELTQFCLGFFVFGDGIIMVENYRPTLRSTMEKTGLKGVISSIRKNRVARLTWVFPFQPGAKMTRGAHFAN